MIKRIGSKLYNTDNAVCVLPEKNLYRAKIKQTYFYFDGETITPVEYEDAAEMIQAAGLADTYLKHKPYGRGNNASLAISADLVDRLAAYCRKNNVSQKQVIEDLIRTLPLD